MQKVKIIINLNNKYELLKKEFGEIHEEAGLETEKPRCSDKSYQT